MFKYLKKKSNFDFSKSKKNGFLGLDFGIFGFLGLDFGIFGFGFPSKSNPKTQFFLCSNL
jgi:hypothetical protein